MKEPEAHIASLEPMLVASVHAFGKNPETKAWQKMEAWAGPIGLLDDTQKHPVFGFNNPPPSPGTTEYGYEFWISVEPEVEAGPGIELKQFEGGLYAVTACNLSDEMNAEFFQKEGYLESWHKLHDWVEASEFNLGSHQSLERVRNPSAPETELILDLYLVIDE